ncbi:helix-turn-helix domain-containing protein [Paraliobacillus ryukyuensis]|nr:helix-turn-helix domain-containing protein [Paraliobacillus ryukyuensis]
MLESKGYHKKTLANQVSYQRVYQWVCKYETGRCDAL